MKFLAPSAAPVPPKPAVVHLPSVPVSFRPTPSPIPVSKQANVPSVNGKQIIVFPKRSDARKVGSLIDLKKHSGQKVSGIGANDRWAVYA